MEYCVVLVSQSCLTLCSLWTVARQAPLSMGFSRKEYWSGLPFPSPGGLPVPGVELRSPACQADSLLSEPLGKKWNITHHEKRRDFVICNNIVSPEGYHT